VYVLYFCWPRLKPKELFRRKINNTFKIDNNNYGKKRKKKAKIAIWKKTTTNINMYNLFLEHKKPKWLSVVCLCVLVCVSVSEWVNIEKKIVERLTHHIELKKIKLLYIRIIIIIIIWLLLYVCFIEWRRKRK